MGARQEERELAVRRQTDLNLHTGGCIVSPCDLGHQLRVDGLRLSNKHGFRFIQGHHGLIDITLRIRAVIDRPFSVLLVIRRVEPIIVELRHGQPDLMKIELKLTVLQSDVHDAVSGVFVSAGVSRERMGRLSIGNPAFTGLCSRLGGRLLALQSVRDRRPRPGRTAVRD